jgi:hypothetical protein
MPRKLDNASSQATLTPAYGRDYKSKKEVLTDFRDGKDFVYNHFRRVTYCSIRDYGVGQMVKFRYNSSRDACFYTVADIDKR